MDPIMIEDIVDSWPDDDRYAFWSEVAYQICEQHLDDDDAIVAAFNSAAFIEMFHEGGE